MTGRPGLRSPRDAHRARRAIAVGVNGAVLAASARARIGDRAWPWLGRLLALACPLAAYTAVLAAGVPAAVGLAVQVEGTRILAAFGLGLVLAFWRPNWITSALACTLVCVLFALPLAALWKSGLSSEMLIGGLWPYSDGNGYLYCAGVLAEGDTFRSADATSFCSRRPFFTGTLAGLLALTGHDLRYSLGALVLLTGVACFLAAQEVRASLGAVAAAGFVLALAAFYRRFTGIPLTEHLGLSLGAVAFTALWRSVRASDFRLFLLGLFVLSLALNARAGTFLVLPALVLWGSRWFPGALRLSWRRLAGAMAVVALGFVLNAALVRAIGTPSGMFSNFSYVLYGVVFGGDWTLVLKQHPELYGLAQSEVEGRVLALALDGIAVDPSRLVTGALRAWREFLVPWYPFQFLGNVTVDRVELFTRLLAVLGVVVCLLGLRHRTCSFMLATIIGVLLSVPFVPPWDADIMRVYAATVPLIMAVPALGIAPFASRPLAGPAEPSSAERGASPLGLAVLTAGLMGLAIASPLVLVLTRHLPVFPKRIAAECPYPTLDIRVPGSMLRVVRDDVAVPRYPVEVREGEFRRGLRVFQAVNAGYAGELASVEAPFVMFTTLGVRPFRAVTVVASPALLPEPKSARAPFWRICAEPARSSKAILMYATSIRPLWPTKK
jgi:hypothetical protein